jgi:chromosome segregation ATPase
MQADLDHVNELYAPCEGIISKLRKQAEQQQLTIDEQDQHHQDNLRQIKGLHAEVEDLNISLAEIGDDKERTNKELRQLQAEMLNIKDAYNEEKTQKEVKDDRIKKFQTEQESLKNVIENLQIQIEEANSSKEKFRRLVQEKDSDIEEFERRCKNLENAKRRVEAQRDDIQLELDDLGSQVANVATLTNKYERELQNHRDQITQLNNDKDQANATARAAEQRAYQYKLDKEAHEEDLENARNTIRRNQQEIEKLTVEAAHSAETEELMKTRRVMQETINELKQQIEEMGDELYEEEKRNNHLNGQLLEFQNLKEKHQREIEEVEDSANSRVAKIKSEMLEKQDDMDQALRKAKSETARRAAAERQLQETRLNLETATNSLSEAGKQINALRAKLNETDEQAQKLKEARQRNEELEKLFEAMRRNNSGTVEDLQGQIDQLTREKRTLQGELADMQVEVDALSRSERAAITARNQQLERINGLEAEIDSHILAEDEARQKAAIAEQNYSKVNIDLETLRTELENMQADLMNSKRKITAMEDEHQENIHELSRKHMQNKQSWAKEKEKVEEDKQLMKKQCDSINRELKRLRPKCQDLENQLIEKDDKISCLETDTKRGQAQLRRLKNENADCQEEIQRLKNRNQRLVVEIEEMTTSLIG